jgi:hypothetical protein
MKKIFFTSILLLSILIDKSAQAQYGYVPNGFFAFAWDINVPLNNKDFIERTSFYGGKIEGRTFITPKFSVGGELSWNSSYQYQPKRTYQFDGGAVTTDLYKYVYNVPFNLNAHYYFMDDKLIMPFAGLGVGAMYSEQDVYFNIYNLYSNNWGFLLRPEAGALIKFGSNSTTAALLGVRYNYATNRESDFNINKIKSLSFQVGIAFMQ